MIVQGKLFTTAVFLCLASAACAGQPDSSQAISQALLSTEAKEHDYNATLHSEQMKQQVLILADILANAGLLTATGYIRDHKRQKYVFITQPSVDIRVPIRQSRKVRKMGQALLRTRDDDYKLAGSIMICLADCLATGDNPGSKRQVLLLEEFYLRNPVISQREIQGNEQLKEIADEVMSNVKSILNQYAGDVQDKALEGLNLKSILGGIENVF